MAALVNQSSSFRPAISFSQNQASPLSASPAKEANLSESVFSQIVNPHHVFRVSYEQKINPRSYSPSMIARFKCYKAKIDKDLDNMKPSAREFRALQAESSKYETAIRKAESLLNDQRKLRSLEREYDDLKIQVLELEIKKIEIELKSSDEASSEIQEKFETKILALINLQLANRYSVAIFKSLNLMMRKENRERIYWVPHCASDTDTFPIKGADISDRRLYSPRTLRELFGAKIYRVIDHSHNEFLKWLYMTPEEEYYYLKDPCVIEEFFICHKPENADKPYFQDLPIFMNCTDFVYFALFHAGLITKAEIQAQYSQTRKAQDPSIFYGFDLSKFVALDPMVDFAQGKRGDILVGFSNETKKPEHVLFLDQFDAEQGWQAISLWSEDKGGPNLDRIELIRYSGSHSFKYCPLAIALENMLQTNP